MILAMQAQAYLQGPTSGEPAQASRDSDWQGPPFAIAHGQDVAHSRVPFAADSSAELWVVLAMAEQWAVAALQ